MYLDAQHRLIAIEDLFRGTLAQTRVYPREIACRALHHNAGLPIVAHNHPSGAAEPSRADEALTKALQTSLSLLDVRLLDHLVIAGNRTTSFAQRELMCAMGLGPFSSGCAARCRSGGFEALHMSGRWSAATCNTRNRSFLQPLRLRAEEGAACRPPKAPTGGWMRSAGGARRGGSAFEAASWTTHSSPVPLSRASGFASVLTRSSLCSAAASGRPLDIGPLRSLFMRRGGSESRCSTTAAHPAERPSHACNFFLPSAPCGQPNCHGRSPRTPRGLTKSSSG